MTSIEQSNDIFANKITTNSTASISRHCQNDQSEKNHAEANGQATGGNGPDDNANAAKKPIDNGNSDGYGSEQLKIIQHLRNIEKVNENRRLFLTNTLRETVSTSTSSSATSNNEKTEKSELAETIKTIKTTATTRNNENSESKIVGDSNGNQKQNDVVQNYNHERIILHETCLDRANGNREIKIVVPTTALTTAPSATTTTTILTSTTPTNLPLKSPLTPPPKPPMLSRTRSLGVGDQRATTQTTTNMPMKSVPQTPTNTPSSPSSPTPNTMPIVSATISASNVATPGKITTLRLQESAPVLRRHERPMSISPDTPKQVSANHYERLIEELKCPGCATPMKAPILLCQTGHSICNQCTRILLMCPLCKEPFTNMRCRTVEALCHKAHFRCCNASGGCTVRLQTDLLAWHEKQCIYKPMKCFMGRVWGDCAWSGREAYWKDHLEESHGNRLFKTHTADLTWNMGVKQKPLTGYYVFDIYDELFNFYEIYDKSMNRVLFTMTCTSTVRERKHNFAFEVTIVHPDNEALAITQKFPVHSEYDKDILAEGTCISISLNDLAKFIDEERLLHYRVRLVEVKSPRKLKPSRYIANPSNGMHPVDFQQTQIEGVNLKGVPTDAIVTRRNDDIPFVDNTISPSSNGTEIEAGAIGLNDEDVTLSHRFYDTETITRESSSESDPELEAYIAKKWGTPQLHFNRKYLKDASTGSTSPAGDFRNESYDRMDDGLSVVSKSTSYTKKMTNSLRKSFRHLKAPIAELKPLVFSKRSPEKKSP